MGGSEVGAKKEECLIAERTWKYARVARTKKNTIVSMGEDAAWIEIGRIKALIVGRLWMYASGPGSLRTILRAVWSGQHCSEVYKVGAN